MGTILREKLTKINQENEIVEGKSISLLQITQVKILCGDAQVIEDRINELLPEWQMDGPLIASGNMFYQKMVKIS